MSLDPNLRSRRPFPAFRPLLAIGLALALTGRAIAGAPYVGQPLHEVLAQFGREGLHLVYSSETVPLTLRVTREPAAGPALDVVRQLLAEHDLDVKAVGADTYAVVRKSAPAPAVAVRPAAPAPAAAPLEEIVVAASRYSLSAEVPDAHTVFTQAEIEGLPRLADDSLKAVHRLPGAASNGVSGLAYMRGGDVNETLVVLDGFPLYEPFHLKVLLSPTSLLDPAILHSVDVHAGGFSAEFGDRMSAVIEATSVHPAADAQYELGLSLFNANLFAFNRFDDGRGQWLVSARRSNLDEVADLLDAQYGELTYSDAFARLDYAFTPETRGSLHALVSMDDADVTNAQETESASANYRNTYVWATLEHDFTPALSARAIASYTYVASERTGEIDEAGIRTGTADDERHFDVLGLLASATYRSERWVARVGAEARSLDASYDYASVVRFEPDYPFPGAPGRVTVNELDPEPSGAHYAAWASVRMQLADPLTAEAGLRWDDETYGPRGGNLVTPRVNLVFDAGPQTLLRASWGRFQQAQGIHELQVEDGLDRFFRPQYAYHYILGVEQRLTHDFTLRVEGYVKDYGSLRPRFESLYDPTSLVPELRWDRVEIWPESALAEGVELLLTRKSDSPWNGWFNYTWSRVKDREDGTDTRRSWDQTNNVGAGLAWSEGAWRATVAGTYHTGWPTTPLRFSSSGAGTGGWVAGPRNADRLPAYATVDVRVSRDFVLRRGTLNVFAEATNLLDRNNPCCTDFSFEPAPGGGFELDREYRDWLPLVPNVGVLWRF